MTLWSRLRWPKRLFLCFHAVDATWLDPGLSVAPDVFTLLIASLAAAGYRGETFSSVVAATGSDRLVAVTFDDGFTSVATQAAPILDDVGWPASVFVPTAPIFDGGSMYWIGAGVRDLHPTATSHVTPEQIRDLASRGWEVGSHSRTHRLLSRLTPAELDHELGSFAGRGGLADRLLHRDRVPVGGGGLTRDRGRPASGISHRLGSLRPLHVVRSPPHTARCHPRRRRTSPLRPQDVAGDVDRRGRRLSGRYSKTSAASQALVTKGGCRSARASQGCGGLAVADAIRADLRHAATGLAPSRRRPWRVRP